MYRILFALAMVLSTGELAHAQVNMLYYKQGSTGAPHSGLTVTIIPGPSFGIPGRGWAPQPGRPRMPSPSPVPASPQPSPTPSPLSLHAHYATIVAPLRASISAAKSLRAQKEALRDPVAEPNPSQAEAVGFDWEDNVGKALEANELIKQIKEKTDRLTVPMEQTIGRFADALEGNPFRSDNPQINLIHDIVLGWNNKHGDAARRDVNKWIDLATLDGRDDDTAIRQLEAERDQFRRFAKACAAQTYVVWALNVADHMDVKNYGQWLVSTKLLDIEARRDTLAEINRCLTHSENAVQQLDRAIGVMRETRETRAAILRAAPNLLMVP
jgi:phage-related minor tail protein